MGHNVDAKPTQSVAAFQSELPHSALTETIRRDSDLDLVRDAIGLISTGVSEIGIRGVLKRYPKVSSDGELVEDKLNTFLRVAAREHKDLYQRIYLLAERNAILLLVDPNSFIPALREELALISAQRTTFKELLSDQRLLNDLTERYQAVGQMVYRETFGQLTKAGRIYCRIKFKLFRLLESRLLDASRFSHKAALAFPKTFSPRDIFKVRNLVNFLHSVGTLFVRACRPIVKISERVGRLEMRFFLALGRILTSSTQLKKNE